MNVQSRFGEVSATREHEFPTLPAVHLVGGALETSLVVGDRATEAVVRPYGLRTRVVEVEDRDLPGDISNRKADVAYAAGDEMAPAERSLGAVNHADHVLLPGPRRVAGFDSDRASRELRLVEQLVVDVVEPVRTRTIFCDQPLLGRE